jgi:hypothetical protein
MMKKVDSRKDIPRAAFYVGASRIKPGTTKTKERFVFPCASEQEARDFKKRLSGKAQRTAMFGSNASPLDHICISQSKPNPKTTILFVCNKPDDWVKHRSASIKEAVKEELEQERVLAKPVRLKKRAIKTKKKAQVSNKPENMNELVKHTVGNLASLFREIDEKINVLIVHCADNTRSAETLALSQAEVIARVASLERKLEREVAPMEKDTILDLFKVTDGDMQTLADAVQKLEADVGYIVGAIQAHGVKLSQKSNGIHERGGAAFKEGVRAIEERWERENRSERQAQAESTWSEFVLAQHDSEAAEEAANDKTLKTAGLAEEALLAIQHISTQDKTWNKRNIFLREWLASGSSCPKLADIEA